MKKRAGIDPVHYNGALCRESLKAMGFHLRGHEFRPTHGFDAMSRIRTLLGGSVLVCLTACSGPTDMTAPTIAEGPGSATMESLASGGMTPAGVAPEGSK